MVRNRAINDEDFVLPTQYPKPSRRMKKKPPPAPKLPPYLEPLPIRNENTYGITTILATPIKYSSCFGLTSCWISLRSIFEALSEPQVHGRTHYRQRTQLFNWLSSGHPSTGEYIHARDKTINRHTHSEHPPRRNSSKHHHLSMLT